MKKYSTSNIRFYLALPLGLLAEILARLANWVSGNQLDVNFNDEPY